MSVDADTTLQHLAALPVLEQIEVLHEAWRRLLESGWQPELSAQQKSELDRRLNDLDANPHNVIPLQQVLAKIRRQG